MGLIDRLRTTVFPPPRPAVDNYWSYVNFNSNTYPIGLNQTLLGKEEKPDGGYSGIVAWAYQSNAVVYACVQTRQQLFAEARFQFRRVSNGRPGDLFGTGALSILEEPWPNGTTGDLLARMLLDADLSGDSFIVRTQNRLARLRPDWVTVITDLDAWEPNAKPIAYAYLPGGPAAGKPPIIFDVSQVAHFAPSPDPLSPHRGMSWLTPVIREISADIGMTEHKRAFLVNGATPNLVISLDPAISKAAFDQWVEAFEGNHRGVGNAYKTMFLGGGAKPEVVGKDLQQLDFKLVQGAGETRIAAAAGVPPVIVGLSEGLQAATYSNYSQARRRFADGTMRPLWRNVSASLSTLLAVPSGAELWIDDRDIAFLQDDMKDRAEILRLHMTTIESGVRSGYEPLSVVAAVTSGDLTKLVHTGLYSVQLQPPMPEGPEPEPEPTEPEPEDEDTETETGRALSEALGIIRANFVDREQPAPVNNVTVNMPEQPAPVTNVTIEQPAITVEGAEITVEPTPVEISVEPTPVEITNEVSVEPTPVTITNEIPEPRSITKRVIRDAKNQITEIVEEPTDG